MVSQAVSMVSSFEADDTDDLDNVGEKQKTKQTKTPQMLHCAILKQFDLEQKRRGGNCSAQLL